MDYFYQQRQGDEKMALFELRKRKLTTKSRDQTANALLSLIEALEVRY